MSLIFSHLIAFISGVCIGVSSKGLYVLMLRPSESEHVIDLADFWESHAVRYEVADNVYIYYSKKGKILRIEYTGAKDKV